MVKDKDKVKVMVKDRVRVRIIARVRATLPSLRSLMPTGPVSMPLRLLPACRSL